MSAFIDTSVLYAMLARETDEHEAASEAFIAVARSQPLVTHAYVEVEAISLVQRRLGMSAVVRLVEDILPAIDVEMVRQELHRRARDDLRRERSRAVSFVDRVSFAFMRERGVHLALAIDDDFVKEGFESLPRPVPDPAEAREEDAVRRP